MSYYSISKNKSSFYQTSKDPREGFEKVTYGKDNAVTYHKYVPKLEGTLQKVSIENKTMRGVDLPFLVVELYNDGGYSDYVSCVLKEYGRFTESAKALASVLNGAEFGQKYTLSCRTKTDGDKSFLNIYMYYVDKFDENNKPVSTGYIKMTDVPKAAITTDELGQRSSDYTDQNKFYTGVLSDILKKSSATTPNERPKAAIQEAPKVSTNPLDEFLKSSIS